MKKLFIALALSLFAVSSQAQVTVTSNVGLDSSYVYRGLNLSNKNPSVNADVTVSRKLGPVTAFGSLDGHTLSFSNSDKVASNVRSVIRGEVGAGYSVAQVGLIEVGLRQNFYNGTRSIGGVNPTDLNNRELFVRDSLKVGNGLATVEYNRVIANAVGSTGHDTFWKAGYTYSVTPKINVGLTGAWKQYDVANVNRYNNTELSANYKVTKNLVAYATESIGYRDASNAKIPNYLSAGLKYTF